MQFFARNVDLLIDCMAVGAVAKRTKQSVGFVSNRITRTRPNPAFIYCAILASRVTLAAPKIGVYDSNY